jgi:maltoporin
MAMRALSAIAVFFLALPLSAQTPPDFTGHWRQQSNSKAQRQLEVEQKGQNLRVKTVVTNSDGTRSLDVRYVIGGAETTYRGLDGDEFRSSVRWDAGSLVFDAVEHEDSNDIPQKAVWTLSADGHTLQVDRQITKSGQTTHSLTTYIRQP